MSGDNKRLIKAILLSGIATILGYLINFFLTPYITDLVGIEAYGFVSIAKTAVSYASIITVALTTFIVRFISVDYLKGDYKEANIQYSSSIIACIGLSLIIFIVACLLVFDLENLLNIPDDLVLGVKILFILTFLNFVLTTVTTPFSSAFFIKNRLDYSSIIKILAYIIESIALIILFRTFQANIWFVGIGSFVSALVTLIGNMILTKTLTPELKYSKSNFSLSHVKQIISNGIWQSINSLGNVLNSGLDLIVSNRYLSAVQTGQIAVVKTIGGMFTILYGVVSQPFQPKLLKAYSSNDKEWFIRELKKAMKICGSLSNIAFAGFVALGELYYQLWLPAQDHTLLYWLTVITITQSVTEGYSYPVYYVYTLTLRKKIPCFITILGGLLNIGGMIILLNYTNIGPYAIVITTTVIMTATNLIFNPMYSMKCIGLKTTTLFPTIVRHILSAVIMLVTFKGIEIIISPTSWLTLGLSACIMLLLGVVIHFIIMGDSNDYNKMKNFVKNKIG